MTEYTAGRFRATVFPGVQNGNSLAVTQLHSNGSPEIVGELRLDADALFDLMHVLTRAHYRFQAERKDRI